MIHLKTSEEIDVIARGGAIIADFLVVVRPRIQPGISTLELDTFADEFIRSHSGAVPAFKGLYGFSGSVCTSINEEVVHGIPKADRVLEDGDIISIDVGVKLDGWCSDSAWTFPVGEIDESTQHLLEVTEDALDRSLAAAVLDGFVGDIGAAVVTRVEGIDAEAGKIYYTGTEESPLQRHLYSIDFDGRNKQRLTAVAGNHSIDMSPSMDYYIDTWSSSSHPRQVELRSTQGGGELLAMLEANPEVEAYVGARAYSPAELFSFTTSEVYS